MAYRYTNTEKWRDSWFSELTAIEKLLFNYLCDNCDIAGFIEYTPKIWAAEIGISMTETKGALKGLGRGLVWGRDETCIYIKNFLKHQKNLPLNEENKAHIGIIRRFEAYSEKFGIQDINEFIEGGSKGLPSPSGNGNGKGAGKGNEYIEQILEIFSEVYAKEFGIEYIITNKGKEESAAGKLAGIYRKKYPEANTEEALDSFRKYFAACCQIQDDWIRNHMSLSIIYSKFNEINKILKDGSKKNRGTYAQRADRIKSIIDTVANNQ